MANKRLPMDREHRAKQFMPFDALKGFREALSEKERILVPPPDLSEDSLNELDRKIRMLQKNSMVTVIFLQKGEYVRLTGMVTGIDAQNRTLRIVKQVIPFGQILELHGDDFHDFCL